MDSSSDKNNYEFAYGTYSKELEQKFIEWCESHHIDESKNMVPILNDMREIFVDYLYDKGYDNLASKFEEDLNLVQRGFWCNGSFVRYLADNNYITIDGSFVTDNEEALLVDKEEKFEDECKDECNEFNKWMMEHNVDMGPHINELKRMYDDYIYQSSHGECDSTYDNNYFFWTDKNFIKYLIEKNYLNDFKKKIMYEELKNRFDDEDLNYYEPEDPYDVFKNDGDDYYEYDYEDNYCDDDDPDDEDIY